MSEPASGPASESQSLPEAPNLDWLRKRARRRLEELRRSDPHATLATAQFDVARQYGFTSWRALKAHIDGLTVDGQLFDAAQRGDASALDALLGKHPAKLLARKPPYEWTLLHVAAHEGHLAIVDLLLARGLNVNIREKGDNTYAMHWAAAAGHLEVVRRLADAGSDVVGHGDDHELGVIGWSTCWDGCDDEAHRAIVQILLSHGARHHIFSAISMNLADELRRIVGEDPAALNQRMSRNEDHRLPLHFAVLRNRPDMVRLLLELGADPLGVDGSGQPAAAYANASGIDRTVMEKIRAMTRAELVSAERGKRAPRSAKLDLIAALALGDWELSAQLVRENPSLVAPGGPNTGVLHLMAQRGDVPSMRWLLDRGVDPNGRWRDVDVELTPLHLAASRGHADAVRLLLDAGADPGIHDSRHDSDAIGWAEYFRRPEIVQLLEESRKKA
jgi:ankyrin repeat protein